MPVPPANDADHRANIEALEARRRAAARLTDLLRSSHFFITWAARRSQCGPATAAMPEGQAGADVAGAGGGRKALGLWC
jgi:hypothetical protein